jgi:cyclic pyranopterin phosphate synthase
MKKLSHFDATGSPRMVDVSAKPETRRTARAHAFVRMNRAVLRSLPENPKGNPLEIARIAGIAAAKKTADLIPLCHPLMLSHADVEVRVEKKGVRIVASAATTAQTGVEMEALTAAAVAALTVYDMTKALDKSIEIQDVYLLEKTGGKSGDYRRSDGASDEGDFPGLAVLERAMEAYSYPVVAFDFENDRELKFPTMRDLECHIQTNLLAGDAVRLKDALSNILYWGFYRMGIRAVRVERFRSQVTADHLECAVAILPNLSGPGILDLRKLRLPEFGKFTFLSKLRTFLDPETYCVLDRRLLQIPALKVRFKEDKTSIPVTAKNEEAYLWWVRTCRRIADALTPPRRPVDVERGFFHLVDTGQIDAADTVLRQTARI